MTKCGYCQLMMDWCTRRAISACDLNLKLFFRNAAEGFRRRLEGMTVAELEQQY